MTNRARHLLWLSFSILAACGGGGGGGGGSNAPTQPIVPPTPVPTPGALSVTPASLTFLTTGSSAAQNVTVSEPNYAGAITVTQCGASATVAVAGSTVTVTPVAPGACTFTVSGASSVAAQTVNVSVTATTAGGH